VIYAAGNGGVVTEFKESLISASLTVGVVAVSNTSKRQRRDDLFEEKPFDEFECVCVSECVGVCVCVLTDR